MVFKPVILKEEDIKPEGSRRGSLNGLLARSSIMRINPEYTWHLIRASLLEKTRKYRNPFYS
jgi:hypothetical protein